MPNASHRLRNFDVDFVPITGKAIGYSWCYEPWHQCWNICIDPVEFAHFTVLDFRFICKVFRFYHHTEDDIRLVLEILPAKQPTTIWKNIVVIYKTKNFHFVLKPYYYYLFIYLL